jgi:hypothetical protein
MNQKSKNISLRDLFQLPIHTLWMLSVEDVINLQPYSVMLNPPSLAKVVKIFFANQQEEKLNLQKDQHLRSRLEENDHI